MVLRRCSMLPLTCFVGASSETARHSPPRFWRRNHYEGSALFDRDLVFLAYEDRGLPGGWGLAWGPNAADATNKQLRISPPR